MREAAAQISRMSRNSVTILLQWYEIFAEILKLPQSSPLQNFHFKNQSLVFKQQLLFEQPEGNPHITYSQPSVTMVPLHCGFKQPQIV